MTRPTTPRSKTSRPVFLAVSATVAAAMTLAAAAVAQPTPRAPARPAATATAIFAGGCFWSAETDMEHIPGVIDAVSGYTGGSERNPTYEMVSSETTGHVEAVKVTYDPRRITYRQLVDKFWRTIDPTDPNGQFCDQGPSYRTAVFATPAQMATAQASRAAAIRSLPGKRFTTPVRPAAVFWPAEAYHQGYWRTHALAYQTYRIGCGRDARLRAVWGSQAAHH